MPLFNVRLSDEEFANLNALSKAQAMTKTGLMRQWIRRGMAHFGKAGRPKTAVATKVKKERTKERNTIAIGSLTPRTSELNPFEPNPEQLLHHQGEGFQLSPPGENDAAAAPERDIDRIVKAVYAAYCQQMGKDPVYYKLTPRRKVMLRARAKETLRACRTKNSSLGKDELHLMATEAMRLCIAAILRDKFMCGENPQVQRWLDLKYIFGSAERMEKWMGA
jgi:hypothetical protein